MSTTSPLYAVADFCLIPMGTPTTSVGEYITECQRVLEGMQDQGIRYEVHGYGTNLEGTFGTVCKAIELCHEAVHRLGAQRIATDIRIGTRTDKPPPTMDGQTENQRKKQSVIRRLAQE
ncbi:uncharacterized protein UMAG_10362 [Mycosarcoma maydis]|uniref:Thiamine-binding protein domain-containing protein n=1 Tax=Mycosarcoma maydis TaxID=5270 RepID=A0A0D1C5Z3_MYCMD|nr:uncharacterized protein UMAG_10362 [Ustilago maydis 521]KIS69047.1 hypothetical protein UMAG_10362 [Ustilago maydis 521]|eukprot:XP_011389504.1 hypothetical protein UMAG_10362 [Ustilago maydis 521]